MKKKENFWLLEVKLGALKLTTSCIAGRSSHARKMKGQQQNNFRKELQPVDVAEHALGERGRKRATLLMFTSVHIKLKLYIYSRICFETLNIIRNPVELGHSPTPFMYIL